MKRIKYLLKFIFDIGIDGTMNITDKFRIRFINGLHFLIAVILIIGVSHWIVLDKKPFTYIELSCLLLSLVGLVLNYFKKFNASYILFYLYTNFLIAYNIELYPKSIAGYVYYFPFAMVLGINVMSSIKNNLSYFLLLFSFVIFLIVMFVDFDNAVPKNWRVEFSEEEITWVRNFNIAIAGLCVIFFTYFYMWLSDAQNREIKDLINKEKHLQQQLIQSLNQKDILLAEVHHRVKNNLTILNSIINMNIDDYEGESTEVVLNSLKNRIYNMSIIHNLLYTHENIDQISIQDFIKKIIHSTIHFNDLKEINITENYDYIGKIKVSAVIPIGIILNEMISNAIRYHVDNGTTPCLNINVYQHNDEIIINLMNANEGFFEIKKDKVSNKLIHALAEQINSKITFNDNEFGIKISIPQEELLSV
ncbi:MAG: sensor histidine kinase [Bacteroidia bacterium]|nr:sensor histidine kinase [Bacteroidia bacterium]